MLIRCWGARGSIPVSGKEYLKYGGDSTCLEIRTKNNEIIIIDAGSGIRKLGNLLLKEKRLKFTLIFTHSHWDHILGFGFFKPIYFSKTEISMFGCPFARRAIKQIVSGSMEPPYFPVKYEDISANISYNQSCNIKESFSIDTVTVTPIMLSHPNKGMGYKFVENGKSFVFLTDNELTYKHPGGLDYHDYVEFSRGADFLIHDTEFKREEYKLTKTWGHSVYNDALNLALEAGVKKFGLFHHNQERTDNELDKIVQDCQSIIKDHSSNLECFALSSGMEFQL